MPKMIPRARDVLTPFFGFCGVLLSNPSYSDLPAGAPASVVVFEPFSTRASTGVVQLANGVKVDPRNWRTIIVAQVGTEVAPNGTLQPVTCSGTLVGPGVFLTAAHCLDGGATAGLRPAVVLKVGGLDLNTQCLVAKGYRDAVAAKVWDGDIPRVSDDYALCHFNPPALLPSDLQNLAYEVIEAAQPLVASSDVLMTGLGCGAIALDASGQLVNSKPDQQLRIGNGTVSVAAPLDASAESNFLQIIASFDHPALCPGDSGGPLLSGVTQTAQVGLRRIRGVNSTMLPAHANTGQLVVVSRIAALASQSFRALTQEWLIQRPTDVVCGINRNAGSSPCAP